MSLTKRVLLGILAIWPLLWFFIFIGFVVMMVATSGGSPSDDSASRDASSMFLVIFPLHILTMLVMFALIAIYVILAAKNPQLDDTTRIIWVIMLAMFAVFAAPVYWWVYVRKAPPAPPEES